MTAKPEHDRDNDKDKKGQGGLPPAGPHARKDLQDPDKTPDTGSLPDDTDAEGDVGPD